MYSIWKHPAPLSLCVRLQHSSGRRTEGLQLTIWVCVWQNTHRCKFQSLYHNVCCFYICFFDFTSWLLEGTPVSQRVPGRSTPLLPVWQAAGAPCKWSTPPQIGDRKQIGAYANAMQHGCEQKKECPWCRHLHDATARLARIKNRYWFQTNMKIITESV